MKTALEQPTGRTAQQMTDAPHGATFVWCNSRVAYPQALAKALGRDDLVVRPLSWLSMRSVCGLRPLHVVADHAAWLDAEARHCLQHLNTKVR